MKILLIIIGSIVAWGFTSSVLWHATIPFWEWTKKSFKFPEDTQFTSEAFAAFLPFWLAISPVILVTTGPIIVGWKLRERLARKPEPQNVQADAPEQDPGLRPSPISFTIGGVLDSELLDALKLDGKPDELPYNWPPYPGSGSRDEYYDKILKYLDEHS